jgi:hypothetical protein
MNYDEYGFPIFDDDWEDDKAFPQEENKSEPEEKPKNVDLF